MPLKTAADMTRSPWPRTGDGSGGNCVPRGDSGANVRSTFLGAHALPPETKGDKGAYIEALLPGHAASHCGRWSRGCGGCVLRAYCLLSRRDGAVLLGYARALISRAPARRSALRSWGRDTGRALQRALGRSSRIRRGAWLLWPLAGTTAVLLPGAFYFIRERRLPPVDAFRFHAVPIALATDCNPGSSPLTSLLLAMNMGATLFRLTVDECSAGVTREAARALGIFNEIGSLESANGAISPSVISKGRGTSLSYGLQPTACARLAW
jgi:imidazolonepropionase